jgi:hypothetical protein
MGGTLVHYADEENNEYQIYPFRRLANGWFSVSIRTLFVFIDKIVLEVTSFWQTCKIEFKSVFYFDC